MRKAAIYMHDALAGWLTEDEEGYHFQYAPAWLQADDPQPVSLTLPLREKAYTSTTLFPFFDGLIPEGWLLDIAQKNWKLNPRDRMGLLLACCRDCIGAVSVLPVYEWTDLKSLQELSGIAGRKLEIKSAVYVWGWYKYFFKTKKKFVPFYVGKTTRLWERLFQHAASLKGGLYNVYNPCYIFSGNFIRLNKVDGENLLYKPDGIPTYSGFFECDIQDVVQRLIENVHFSWIETEEEDNACLEKYVTDLFEKNGHNIAAVVKDSKGYSEKDRGYIFSGNPVILDLLGVAKKVER